MMKKRNVALDQGREVRTLFMAEASNLISPEVRVKCIKRLLDDPNK